MKKLIALSVVAVVLAMGASRAAAAVIIDQSTIPINDSDNGFGPVGGVQFLNHTTFHLETVTILLGLQNPGVTSFQVYQFDGGLGDTTGTLIGSVPNVAVGGLPFADFAGDSATADVSALNLTLLENVVYGFALSGGGEIRGGSSGNIDLDPDIGTMFNGDGFGNFATLPSFEIPFVATGALVDAAVPGPGALVLLGLGLGLVGLERTVRRYRVRS